MGCYAFHHRVGGQDVIKCLQAYRHRSLVTHRGKEVREGKVVEGPSPLVACMMGELSGGSRRHRRVACSRPAGEVPLRSRARLRAGQLAACKKAFRHIGNRWATPSRAGAIHTSKWRTVRVAGLAWATALAGLTRVVRVWGCELRWARREALRDAPMGSHRTTPLVRR